jgi:hypothetical protein
LIFDISTGAGTREDYDWSFIFDQCRKKANNVLSLGVASGMDQFQKAS